ncbi:Hsp20/alpha crystallin family protein [Candidatus Poribacteria bacterium]|nr:Hsp20/alpha crystallin family protein [Candidatus Poribacteria bacterium]
MRHLATRRPVGNLFNLHNEMGKIFGDLFASQESETNGEPTSWMPTVDISEMENGFEIRAELPGVTESDVNVSVTDNLLTIKGEKRQEKETDNKNYHRVERRYGSFQRSFTLPRNVETADIKAGYKDGVLTLTIPKVEAAKPTEIPITANA